MVGDAVSSVIAEPCSPAWVVVPVTPVSAGMSLKIIPPILAARLVKAGLRVIVLARLAL